MTVNKVSTDHSKFDAIRPFYDDEINDAIRSIKNDPMMAAIMRFTFPNRVEEEWLKQLDNIYSIQDFQAQIVAKILIQVLAKSSDGLTTSGFDKLDKTKPYLFISNHRDIILDTSLIMFSLFNHGVMMTSSAIGDNLLKHPFLYTLSRINRNFIVKRGLQPRELLESSKLMSEYIQHLLTHDKRSVWLAQREGRTKDGNDATNPGILKMLAMAGGKEGLVTYFKTLNIVPVTISYEYDPTDSLKIPELLANLNNEKYIKGDNEDFNSIMNGILGQKKRIHIHAGTLLNDELDSFSDITNANQQIKAIAQLIDRQIIGNYRLFPPNYIAFDLLHKTHTYTYCYRTAEKDAFVKRMGEKIDVNDAQSVERFLSMYASPVVNKERLGVEFEKA
jgi:1-acyl-sn-glycerol-3-phosphate acyltransferase